MHDTPGAAAGSKPWAGERAPVAEGTVAHYVTPTLGPLLVPHLPRLLEVRIHYRPPPLPLPRQCIGVVGWGLKGKALHAAALAERSGLPYVSVEDGFLRSVDLGDVDPPLSVVVDDLGVYYDAGRPSRLEQYVAAVRAPQELARGADLAVRWRAGRLSKYNHAREAAAARSSASKWPRRRPAITSGCTFSTTWASGCSSRAASSIRWKLPASAPP